MKQLKKRKKNVYHIAATGQEYKQRVNSKITVIWISDFLCFYGSYTIDKIVLLDIKHIKIHNKLTFI